MKPRFQGKVALLSGAASGIGRATALRLASESGSVFGIDVNERGLQATAERVREAGGKMEFATCDVRRRDACGAAVDACLASFGGLDVLGNIAGVNRFHHFHEMSEEDWNTILSVNLSGVAFLCQAALPRLIERGGNIVNIASTAGKIGQAYDVAYCASKGGVVQLTRALAMEYMKTGIRVNAIAPGGVQTEMNEDIRFPEAASGGLIRRYTGFRGLCAPEEIAGAFAFLASDDARSVHGAIWSIDGGMTAG